MKPIIRRASAALASVAVAASLVVGCTERTEPPRPDGTMATDAPPEYELPAGRPSCEFHGLPFGKANLDLGDEDVRESIAWVQQWLSRLPYDQGGTLGLRRTGHFDDPTHHAVWTFQGVQGLREDGIVGPETWRELGTSVDPRSGCRDEPDPCQYVGLPISAANVNPATNREGAENVREDVLLIQDRWNSLPAADKGTQPRLKLQRSGVFDAATDLAVGVFQAARGLEVDRQVGLRTWSLLAKAAGVSCV